jgi:hypothetical protein
VEAGFDPNRCDCDNDCPNEPHCICILIHDEHRCICDCWTEVIGPKVLKAERSVAADAMISLSTKEATLAQVGAKLATIATADVLVPGLDLDKPVALSLKGVTLDRRSAKRGSSPASRPTRTPAMMNIE